LFIYIEAMQKANQYICHTQLKYSRVD